MKRGKKTLKKSKTAKKTIPRRVKRKGEKANHLIFVKSPENPIVSPKPENNWEGLRTFNPGAVLLENRVHFLYRAIGEDGISRFGYAASEDCFTIDERLSHPVYEHKTKSGERVFPPKAPRLLAGRDQPLADNYYSFASGGSFGGAEDPRIVHSIEEDTLYMTYTACDKGLRVALASIKVEDFLQKRWKWKSPTLISPPGEIHKNWVIFPEKINGKYAILHSISPKISIAYRESLEFQEGEYIHSYYNGNNHRENCWDSWLRGVGAPPVKTHLGWLLFYHAMDNDWSKYKVGAMLLDLDDPIKILHRASQPVLEPEEDYENSGFKAGVVYVSGAVIKNGDLLVYYGASDSYIGVAHAPLEKFLGVLTKEAAPKLKAKTLKKKYYDHRTIR